jgi:hypothetical protein
MFKKYSRAMQIEPAPFKKDLLRGKPFTERTGPVRAIGEGARTRIDRNGS